MKKILLTLLSCTAMSSFSAIVYNDFADLTTDGSQATVTTAAIDIDNDGIAEFVFEDQGTGGFIGGGPQTLDISADKNIVSFGTLATGGWDEIAPLTLNTTINQNNLFEAQGDANINASWATTSLFPESLDTYIGVKFQKNNITVYGWIRVNVRTVGQGQFGGAQYQVQFLDAAYDDSGAAIKTGDEGTLTNILSSTNKSLEINMYPNPSSNQINFNNTMQSISISNLNGKVLIEASETKSVSISSLENGVYLVQTEKGITKLIKE